MIDKSNLTTTVQYKGAKINEDFMLIGFVDIMHNGNLVFHQNLTQRTLEDVKDLSAEEIQALAQAEADEIVASECCLKCCEDYITLCNLGLYGEE